jgi:putative transposase
MKWIDAKSLLPITKQCDLSGVCRASVYAAGKRKPTGIEDLTLCRLIDAEYTRHPFYGSRRMVIFLRKQGYVVNRKRVRRLMKQLGLVGMAPGPNTSAKHPTHDVYPYLLRGLEIIRPNQVWSIDITYVRLAKGFAYLVAIIDWYSRRVLSWRISNSMEASFCVDCLEDALSLYGKPDIFNSDQGSQFTSHPFISVLEREKIAISMDGRGRALDNIFVERLWRTVKYEDIYLKDYSTLTDLIMGLAKYFAYYNTERPHQALAYQTPDDVYANAQGGGASIPDYFKDKREDKKSLFKKTGQRCSAADQQQTA